jgi:hypothetical protein
MTSAEWDEATARARQARADAEYRSRCWLALAGAVVASIVAGVITAYSPGAVVLVLIIVLAVATLAALVNATWGLCWHLPGASGEMRHLNGALALFAALLTVTTVALIVNYRTGSI